MVLDREEFDGVIDGRPVKVIVKAKENASREKLWFAKPKGHDLPTPDFRENDGILSIHMDSPCGEFYRVMEEPVFIASGSLPAGRSFFQAKGLDTVVLPMTQEADGFVVLTTASGSQITMPVEGWCLMAAGKWGAWRRKPEGH